MLKLRKLLADLNEIADTWSDRGSSIQNRGSGAKPGAPAGKCPPGEVRNKQTNRCMSLRGARRG